MKICVISDLHCRYKREQDENADTFLFANIPRRPVNQHPVAALIDLINKEQLACDYLICPGDLGDKADEMGIISSWGFLQEINSSLKSKLLLAIPGNHDINSRQQNGKGPFDFIKAFHEHFPVKDDSIKNNFWEDGFCFVEDEDILFCLINTVLSHTDTQLAKQSEIKDILLEKIKDTFDSTINFKGKRYKVAVLHHHPIHHSDILNWRDTDMVNKGDRLLQLLNELDFDIVIHGHKHQPRIVEINRLPIFAAGSFSSFANLSGSGIGQMFHIVELNDEKKGNIYSWEFDFRNGWKHKLNINFPPRVGFGAEKSIKDIAEAINTFFSENGKSSMLFEDVLNAEENIKYTIPEQLIKLKAILNDKYNLVTSPEFPLEPVRISLKAGKNV